MLGAVGEDARGRLVDIAVTAERVIAWATSLQAQAVAGLHEQFLAEHDLDHHELTARTSPDGQPARRALSEEMHVFEASGRAASACLSLALGISAGAADRLLALGLGLADLPDLAHALTAGRLDASQARTITQTTAALPPTPRAALVASLVGDPSAVADTDTDAAAESGAPAGVALVRELRDGTVPLWGVPAHRLRPIIAREIAAIAPDLVEDREVVVARGRRVAYQPGTADYSGQLVLHGPEAQLAAVYGHLDAGARTARRAGAPETLDQLRYDLAAGALTDGAFGLTLTAPNQPAHPKQPARPRVMVDVVVAADTLLGLDQAPATLRTAAGDVPISAVAARQLAHDTDATWRRILTDPATGTALDVSPRYAPPARMADYVKVRDGNTSRHPTSGARHLELDHVEAYDHAHPRPRRPDQPGQPRRGWQTRPPDQDRPDHHRHRQRQRRAHLPHRRREHLPLPAPPVHRPQTRTAVLDMAIRGNQGNPSSSGARRHPSRLTPRAMTSTDVISAAVACTPISSFVRGRNGIVSVGLNADEFVSDTYR